MYRLCTLLFISVLCGCASSPRIDLNYNSSSRVVLLNGLGSEATYSHIGWFSRSEENFSVDWGIPELAEEIFVAASEMRYLEDVAPSALSAIDLDELATILKKNTDSEVTNSLRSLCDRNSADAVVVLGTKYLVWNIGGLTYYAGGYGAFSGAVGGKGKAYALIGAGVIDCRQIWITHSSWVQRELVSFEGKSLPKDPQMLTAENLAFIRPYVIEALTTSADKDGAPALEQIATSIDGIFSRDPGDDT